MRELRRAVVVGRAAGALDEYARATALCRFDAVLVVGMMITKFPAAVDHAVSFHVELFDLWAAERARAGFAPVGTYWGARYRGRNLGEKTTRSRPLRYAPCLGGSSGFLAAHGVALGELRVDRVVLAGVPMSAEACHEGSRELWREASKYWATWETHAPEMVGRVRSMSGRTRDLLGEPDPEFLGL